MAKTPWPLALKQVYGTPDFDEMKQRLEATYKSALKSQETIGELVDTVRTVADGFDGMADQVGGLQGQLGDLKHRLDRVAGGVHRLDDGLNEVKKDVRAQHGQIDSAKQTAHRALGKIERMEHRLESLWAYIHLLGLHNPDLPQTHLALLLRNCGIDEVRKLSEQDSTKLWHMVDSERQRFGDEDDDARKELQALEQDDVDKLVRHARTRVGRG